MMYLEKNKKNIYFNSIFSVIVGLSTWLSSYSSFLPGVTITDFLLLYALIYYFLKVIVFNKKITILYMLPIVLLMYLYLSSMFNAIIVDEFNASSVLNRNLKFTFFWIISLFLIPNFLLKNRFFKTIEILAWVACVGLIIQYIGYYIGGVYIELKLPVFNYANEAIESIDFQLIRLREFRPDSIFLEPAHMTVFLATFLSILLFNIESKTRYFTAIIVSIFMIMTTSSTSIFLIGILWLIHFIYLLAVKKSIIKSGKFIFASIIVLAIFVPIFLNIPQLFYTVQRISDPSSVAVTGRLDAGEALVQSLMGVNRWIGVGFGNLNEGVYMNGINYLLYTSGFLGLLIYLFILIIPFFKTDFLGKVSIMILILLAFSRPNVISVSIIMTSALVFIGYQNKKKNVICR